MIRFIIILLIITTAFIESNAQCRQLNNIISETNDFIPLNRVMLTYQDSVLVFEKSNSGNKTIYFFGSQSEDSVEVNIHCFFVDGKIAVLADSSGNKLTITKFAFNKHGFHTQDVITYKNARNIKLYPDYITFEIENNTYVFKDGRQLYKLKKRFERVYLDSADRYYCPVILNNKILIETQNKQYSIGINERKLSFFINYNTIAYDTTWGTGFIRIDYDNSRYTVPKPGFRIQYANDRTGLYIFTFQNNGLFLYKGSMNTFAYPGDFLGDNYEIISPNYDVKGSSELIDIKVNNKRIKVSDKENYNFPISGSILYDKDIIYSTFTSGIIYKKPLKLEKQWAGCCTGMKSVTKETFIFYRNIQTSYCTGRDYNAIKCRPLEHAQFTDNPVVNGYMNKLGFAVLQEFSGSLIAAVERGRIYGHPGIGKPWEYDIEGRSLTNSFNGKLIGIGDSSTLVYIELPHYIQICSADLYQRWDRNHSWDSVWKITDSIYIGPNKLVKFNDDEYIGSEDGINLFYFNPKSGNKAEFGSLADKTLLNRIKFFKMAGKQLIALSYDNDLLLFDKNLRILDSLRLTGKNMNSVTIVGAGKKQEIVFSSLSVNEALERKLLTKTRKTTSNKVVFAIMLNGRCCMWNNKRKTFSLP